MTHNRGFIFVLLTLLLVTAVAFFSASAEEAVSYDREGNSIGVVLKDLSPEQEYMLFFMEEEADMASLSSDNILFMDQVRSDSAGSLSLLYIAPEFQSCDVYVAGVFPDEGDSPRLVGRFSFDGVPEPEEPSEKKIMHAPGGLVTIEDGAFEGSAFTHIYLGEQVTSIGSRAFAGCENLYYIEIPASVLSIAEDAFEGSGQVIIGCLEESEAYQYALLHGYAFRLIEE